MTHMHIPDGILPVWLWAAGFLVMALVLGLSLFLLRTADMKKKIPLLGALSAVMLVAMSIPILPPYHINLSVVSGILLGPALGFMAAFIANLFLIGHHGGGISVLGLNTLLLGSEAVLGHTFFFLLTRRFPVFWRAAVATVLTLVVTSFMLIGIVAVSGADPARFLHDAEHAGHTGETRVSVHMFAAMVLTLGAVGWLIEAAITGAVLKFVSQVKPDLLQHILHDERPPQESGVSRD